MDRVVPLYIGPANAEAATGCSWRWCRDMARALGVPLLAAGRKQVIDAAKFRAALEALTAEPTTEPAEVADPAQALRERLGLRVVGGGR